MGKKSKIKKVVNPKTMTIISAIVTFISFAYKCGLGIMTTSMVLIIASLSTLMVFICKLAFIKNMTATREAKKKAYLVMTIACLSYVVMFICFVVLKVFGIDTSNKKTYEGWVGSLLLLIMIIMFVLSIIKLRGALNKNDLVFTGLKEMIFISALTDAVIINEYVTRIILRYIPVPFMDKLTAYVPLGISGAMLLVVLRMFIRFAKYETKTSTKQRSFFIS